MDKKYKFQFKTLLTHDEFTKLRKRFNNYPIDTQTNYYFDTPRFSLKALDASLRIREREHLELTWKRKKGYNTQEVTLQIDQDAFDEIIKTGVLQDSEIKTILTPLIGEQKLNNYIALSTDRIYLTYKSGMVLIDESLYKNDAIGLNQKDYELSFLVSNYNEGKKEFIQLLKELEISYQKSEKKIKRALRAYKKLQ